jgi:hypothetical protein
MSAEPRRAEEQKMTSSQIAARGERGTEQLSSTYEAPSLYSYIPNLDSLPVLLRLGSSFHDLPILVELR